MLQQRGTGTAGAGSSTAGLGEKSPTWGRGSPCCPPSPACLGACGQTGSPQDQGEHRALLHRELQVSTLLSGWPVSLRPCEPQSIPRSLLQHELRAPGVFHGPMS